MPKSKNLIAITADVTINAADSDAAKSGPRTFDVTFYTGGAMDLGGYDLPVVIDLAGLKTGKVLVANLDHDRNKRVGNFDLGNDGKQLTAKVRANAVTASRDEVVQSADAGYQWQASLEVAPNQIEMVSKGKKVTVNGQSFTGPLYVTRDGTLKGFAFVTHGADDNTTVTIAAGAALLKGNLMNPELKAFAESLGLVAEDMSDAQIASLQAAFDGKPVARADSLDAIINSAKAEDARRQGIADIIATAIANNPGRSGDFTITMETLGRKAMEAKWSLERTELEVTKAAMPQQRAELRGQNAGLNNKILEAAICKEARLADIDKHFSEQTLDATDKFFSSGISLKQLFLIAAQANGFRETHCFEVTRAVMQAAFADAGPHRVMDASAFSTVSLSTIMSNIANKFLRIGWDSVDSTHLKLAAIRSANDLKEFTTVSLVGSTEFQPLGPGGELKHGALGEVAYSNKADTYGILLALLRSDIINDDLGALYATPRKIGRGGALKLADLFWTAFLDNADFFKAGNNNVSTADGTLSLAGLEQAETIFMEQTGPDNKPLGIQPKILLVPTALKARGLQLMNSELIRGNGADTGDANVWRGRFELLSAPYMSNAAYTGNSSGAWYLLASPDELPVIEIAALKGRVEPTVESADADFQTLGVQMRGYSDVGVKKQEYRGGVRADGSGA